MFPCNNLSPENLYFCSRITFKRKKHVRNKRIKTALVSVYHKDGLDAILAKLHEEGVEFMSTGGAASSSNRWDIPARQLKTSQPIRQFSAAVSRRFIPKFSEAYFAAANWKATSSRWHNTKSRK